MSDEQSTPVVSNEPVEEQSGPVDEVEIREHVAELDGAHYYDEPDVRVPEVQVYEDRGAQVVSVSVDEHVDPEGPLAFQVPRESLGSMGLPLHNLSLGTPQQQFDKADSESDSE